MQGAPALAEELLEVDVADVARVVVSRDDDQCSHSILSRYAFASAYSCWKPNVVRSPEQMTMSGSSSLISMIARSARFGTKYGEPQ